MKTECQDYFMYDNASGSCLSCPAQCSKCDANGCLLCKDANPFLFTNQTTGGRNCLSQCPAGTRPVGSDFKTCVPCSPNCANCATETYFDNGVGDYVQYEICLACDSTHYKFGETGCVTTCPDGWVNDDLLHWCVKCSCECETCSMNKENCTECAGDAFLLNGKCVTPSHSSPYAQFTSDYSSFQLFYPAGGINLGYRSNFSNYVDSPLLTCNDKILDVNWNNASFQSELANIKAIFQNCVASPKELDYLNKLAANLTSLP